MTKSKAQGDIDKAHEAINQALAALAGGDSGGAQALLVAYMTEAFPAPEPEPEPTPYPERASGEVMGRSTSAQAELDEENRRMDEEENDDDEIDPDHGDGSITRRPKGKGK